MLSAPHKSKRKRRRRKKPPVASAASAATADVQSEDGSPPQSANAIGADGELPPELAATEQPIFPQLNEHFLRQEAEIETAMLLKKFNEDTDHSTRKEFEIAFFTSSIGLEDGATDQRTEGEIEADVDVLPTPSSVRTMHPDDGPQYASSYLHDDDKCLVEPYQKTSIEFDEQLLFLPELSVSTEKQPRQPDIEAVAAAACHRMPANEGLFVHEQPELVNRNHAQMINRLVEEHAWHWLDADGQQIAHLASFLSDRRPFKSDGGRKMRPVLYPFTSVETSSAAYALQDKVLKIRIQDLLFEQHPSYSQEQLIARKVEQLYNQYAMRRQTDVVAGLQMKLDVLRQLITSSAPMHSGEDSVRSSATDDSCNRTQRNELRDLRNRLHREEKTDRDILQGLLQEWRALKMIREKQKMNQTQLRLVIKTREVDAADDEQNWNYRFNLEMNEIYEEAMEFYREERRLQQTIVNLDGSVGDIEQLQKTRRPDLDEIRQQLHDIYANCVRPPGEQIVDFELVKSGASDGAAKMPSDMTKYVVQLMLDDKEVSSVRTSRMDQNGRVHLNELFSIRLITKIPDNIRILVSKWLITGDVAQTICRFIVIFQIYEIQTFLCENKIAELFPPIPFETESYARASPMQMSFTSAVSQHAGKLNLIIGWASVDDVQLQQAQRAQSMRTPTSGESKMRQIVQRWYDEHLIDPMDPDNSALIEYIHDSAGGGGDTGTDNPMNAVPADAFRLNEDLTAFCGSDKLDNDKRLKLLTARFNSDLKLKNCRLVPHTEIEIEVPEDLKIFEDMLWVDPIDVQRYQGKTYLKHVYDIITNHCETMNRDYSCHDLLIGDTPPTLLGVMEAISNIFSPRRPLHPKRRTVATRRFVKYPTVAHIDRFNIILNVVRASGIPYRTSIDEQHQQRRISVGSSFQNSNLSFIVWNAEFYNIDHALLIILIASATTGQCATIHFRLI